jgi:hypothetical protein
MFQLNLTEQEFYRLRLLLDSEYRRLHREAPFAFSDPQTYASAIDRIRSQVMWLEDKSTCT